MHFQWRRKPPKLPLPLRFCQPTGGGPSHGDRKDAQKIWYRSRVWFWRYARGQTDTQKNIQTCSLQYFATAPAGEVKMQCKEQTAIQNRDVSNELTSIRELLLPYERFLALPEACHVSASSGQLAERPQRSGGGGHTQSRGGGGGNNSKFAAARRPECTPASSRASAAAPATDKTKTAQLINYRTISANCVPRKRDKSAARNTYMA